MKLSKRTRSQKGSLLIEMTLSLPIMLVILGLSLNMVLAIMAHVVVDDICVDAARAASMAPDKETAVKKISAVEQSHATETLAPKVTLVEFNQLDGNYSNGPYLVIESSVNYVLPFPMPSLSAATSSQQLKLSRTYAYPILPVKQAASS